MSIEQIPLGHAVFSMHVSQDETIPIGVVMWDEPNKWWKVRLVRDDETIAKLLPEHRRIVALLCEKLDLWAATREVPKALNCTGHGVFEPWDSRFWYTVHMVLRTNTRLSEPEPLELFRGESRRIHVSYLFDDLVLHLFDEPPCTIEPNQEEP